MTGLGTALRAETLAWRRSAVQRIATPLLVLLVPVAAVGLVALARSGAVVGAGAAKLAPYATGDAATTQLVAAGQVLSVAALLATGFAAAAAFAQPLADGRAGAYFGLATPRSTVALARCLVLLGWAAACAAGAVLLAVAASAVPSAGLGAEAWAAGGRALVAGLLAAGLALPFGAVATATRSPLATVGALIGVVAVTQMVVLVGGGAWFPYAVPSLWTGMGGPAAASAVGPVGLLLAAAAVPVGLAVVAWQWRRLTDV
ncbi:ABC-2 type transport system permease protein [Isoptericola sp. CG 20/1183]|uniref:ABC-2 type transport system permease protein n=1 Tax=Isoptericola halotolerans TaxID=300560 RepID=A0ABX5EG22_9MICO|nr:MULTISPECIES: ABC transporter permease [Isoptericola]PRZ08303.1 ABC-2 type transport system permease protein [Isoptericola halotolerans]PRZ09100.1 ABC-2 type transport system permease protein [Isoptericola sp. CG 20/1183]